MKARQLTLVAMMTAVICVLSPWSIPLPFTAVPITLGTLGVCLAAGILGAKKGVLSVALFLVIGGVGVPVFSQFTGGFSHIAGPTGGYMAGYLLLALSTGWFIDRFGCRLFAIVCGMALGLAACYALGTVWLSVQSGMTIAQALMAAVVPFIPGDLLKLTLAASLVRVLRPQLERRFAF